MENHRDHASENDFKMELINKSGKELGSGVVKIKNSYLQAHFCNKTQKKSFEFQIPLKDIVAMKEIGAFGDCLVLEMHYIKQFTQRILKIEKIRLKAVLSEATYFQLMINDILHAFPRPKRLVIFINPISGRKKGLKIYREYMAPLCKLCGIECEVIVTTRRGQALEMIDSYDLSNVDGIVTVGGDGIFSECVNGLLRRHQRENSVNINDIDSPLLPCNLPIGMIPAGSGNVLIEFLHGNKDINTAVLRIILGDVTRTNVAGVHQEGRLSVYACLILGFGLCGRMVRDCEKTRWMGPSRYSVAPLKSLLTRKTYDVEISPLTLKDSDSTDPQHRYVTRTKSYDYNGMTSIPNRSNQFLVSRSRSLDYNRLSFRRTSAISKGKLSLKRPSVSPVKHESPSRKRKNSVWFKEQNSNGSNGKSIMVKSAKQTNVISTVNGSASNGYRNISRTRLEYDFYRAQHSKNDETLRDRVYSVDTWIPTLTDINDQCLPVFGDTKLTAHSVRQCSFSNHLKHLLRVNSRVAFCFKFDFVHSLRGKGYRVRIFPDDNSRRRNKYYLNYDGDALLLKSTEFEVRLHRNIVKLFGTIEQKEKHKT